MGNQGRCVLNPKTAEGAEGGWVSACQQGARPGSWRWVENSAPRLILTAHLCLNTCHCPASSLQGVKGSALPHPSTMASLPSSQQSQTEPASKLTLSSLELWMLGTVSQQRESIGIHYANVSSLFSQYFIGEHLKCFQSYTTTNCATANILHILLSRVRRSIYKVSIPTSAVNGSAELNF